MIILYVYSNGSKKLERQKKMSTRKPIQCTFLSQQEEVLREGQSGDTSSNNCINNPNLSLGK